MKNPYLVPYDINDLLKCKIKMDIKNAQITVELATDLDTLTIVGKIKDGEHTPTVDAMMEAISNNFFTSIGDWITEFKNLIQVDKHLDAFILFEKHIGLIQFFRKNHCTQVIEQLLLFDKQVLTKEQRKNYYLYLVDIASKQLEFGIIAKHIDEFLEEFSDEIELEVKQSMIVAKANAAAQNNKIRVANYLYSSIIDDENTSAANKAWSYRGLSLIAVNKDDRIIYSTKALDKWMELGDKKQATNELIGLSRIFDKDNTAVAIEYINKAIILNESDNILDNEYAAGLHHLKARYLLSCHDYKQALVSIEAACKLRDGILGNEVEQHASNFLALQISGMLKDADKIAFYNQKLIEVAQRIQNNEFEIHLKLAGHLNRRELVPQELIKRIEELPQSHLKFGLYIYNTTLDYYSVEDKLNWADKALLLLQDEKRYSNQDYSSAYSAIADIYRKSNNINDAVINYEKSLEYNPWNFSSAQKCGVMLWEAKEWLIASNFFKKHIDTVGELPNLTYAYARSLYECGKYQDSVNYFMKVIGKIENVDINEYIKSCIEKGASIQLKDNSLQPALENKGYIDLDSFKDTLNTFALDISSKQRMSFWQKKDKKYEWIKNPESYGKNLLISALHAKYGSDCIEIVTETPAGAGRIDILAILRGGTKIVIEIKMCGSPYSSDYAISGKDQLLHYLRNSNTHVGFLVIFDGRVRDFGKGLKETESIENFTIFPIFIELNPKRK